MKIIVTGAAGFIGFHLINKLLQNKNLKVLGLDSFNSYYSTNIKKFRIKILNKKKNFFFKKINLLNKKKLKKF